MGNFLVDFDNTNVHNSAISIKLYNLMSIGLDIMPMSTITVFHQNQQLLRPSWQESYIYNTQIITVICGYKSISNLTSRRPVIPPAKLDQNIKSTIGGDSYYTIQVRVIALEFTTCAKLYM